MATRCNRPYAQFNFLVDLGDDQSDGPQAGFQECSNLGIKLRVAEYQDKEGKGKSARKITGLNKSTDVTLKRGAVRASTLSRWLDDICKGNRTAFRNVVVHLQNEDHTAIVQTSKLRRARIIKHISGPLNADGTDVAVEEFVLAYERLEVE
jgi:phage tail-like protein